MTDNPTRTVSRVKELLNKYGYVPLLPSLLPARFLLCSCPSSFLTRLAFSYSNTLEADYQRANGTHLLPL